jgi:allantoinase
VIAELEAIERAILFASETGCALHIVHVSSGRGVSLVTAARARGVDVTCETCPHYLVLTEDMYQRPDGYNYIMSPPLRSAADNAEAPATLRQQVSDTVRIVRAGRSEFVKTR